MKEKEPLIVYMEALNFGYGDYLVIPRGTIYQINFNDENNRFLLLSHLAPLIILKDIAMLTAS